MKFDMRSSQNCARKKLIHSLLVSSMFGKEGSVTRPLFRLYRHTTRMYVLIRAFKSERKKTERRFLWEPAYPVETAAL